MVHIADEVTHLQWRAIYFYVNFLQQIKVVCRNKKARVCDYK